MEREVGWWELGRGADPQLGDLAGSGRESMSRKREAETPLRAGARISGGEADWGRKGLQLEAMGHPKGHHPSASEQPWWLYFYIPCA